MDGGRLEVPEIYVVDDADARREQNDDKSNAEQNHQPEHVR